MVFSDIRKFKKGLITQPKQKKMNYTIKLNYLGVNGKLRLETKQYKKNNEQKDFCNQTIILQLFLR
jgi:hypothetical protein